MNRLDPMNRIVFATSFLSQYVTARRGDEHRKQCIGHRWLVRNTSLGPLGGPVRLSNVLSKGAKHNQFGRTEKYGLTAHMDPMRDTCSWVGLMWLYRLVVMREKIPRLDSKEAYHIPVFPSVKKDGPISPEQYRANWSAAFNEANLKKAKKTSIMRLLSYHNMDDNGVPEEQRARLAGHQKGNNNTNSTKSLRENYQTNIPLKAAVSQARGDPKHTEQHCPCRLNASVPDELLNLIPEVHEQVSNMHAVHAAADRCKTLKEQLGLRLKMGPLASDSLVGEIRMAFQMLASRPVDPVCFVVHPDPFFCMNRFLMPPFLAPTYFCCS